MEDFIRRRIEFLLEEARQPSPKLDLAVTYAFRAVWNWYAVGNSNASSKQLQSQCRYRSLSAHQQITDRSDRLSKERYADLQAEHEYPILRLWDVMRSEANQHTSETINAIIQANPIVVVTKAEHKRIDHKLVSDRRYASAGVGVVWRNEYGDWVPRPAQPII